MVGSRSVSLVYSKYLYESRLEESETTLFIFMSPPFFVNLLKSSFTDLLGDVL